jgi:hypothetical protein
MYFIGNLNKGACMLTAESVKNAMDKLKIHEVTVYDWRFDLVNIAYEAIEGNDVDFNSIEIEDLEVVAVKDGDEENEHLFFINEIHVTRNDFSECYIIIEVADGETIKIPVIYEDC